MRKHGWQLFNSCGLKVPNKNIKKTKGKYIFILDGKRVLGVGLADMRRDIQHAEKRK